MTNPQQPPRRAAILIIMDGIGLNPSKRHNAVAMADTPNLDRLYASYPTTVVEASGLPVGLPSGQMGNSEVGHLTLGCGSVLRQDLVKINDAIDDGSLQKNPALVSLLTKSAAIEDPQLRIVNLVGLVSDGGIHSHLDHLLALIELCREYQVKPHLHMITDGRDTAPRCAQRYVDAVSVPLQKAGGAIVSVCGRFYAMDRDKRWDRVQAAWELLTAGVGASAANAAEAIESSYQNGDSDEFINPTVLPGFVASEKQDPAAQWLFFNFRNDRPRELSEALASEHFDAFERGSYQTPELTTLTRYAADYPFAVAFEKEVPATTLGEVVSQAGIAQLRAAETEKYPHVTFFFSGGREEPFEFEQRLLVDSPKVETYDLQPEMSAKGIHDGVLAALQAQQAGLIVVNFANGDMVGHTGVGEAVIKAVEVVDECVGSLVDVAVENNYSVLLTADHGNADMLVDPVSGSPHTQHTTFPVAATVIDKTNWRLANGCGLTSIAPTLLQLMGLEQPAEMTGPSLLLEALD